MDDLMDLMAGNDLLRRRIEAYADLRLSPDLATSSRLRARVLAIAHRHASLARADAALTVLSAPDAADARTFDDLGRVAPDASPRAHRARRHWTAGAMLAASLGAAMVVGAAWAAQPGGRLYEARVWAETLSLPGDPSARAVAELGRLRERLREIGEASRAGDAPGAMASLAAYEAILEQASAAAILADDDVAAAVLETGVGQNVDVLRALANTVPTNASWAITHAVDAAIAHSTDAVQRIGASRPGGGREDGAGSGPADPPRATKAPTAEPTPARTARPKPTDKVTGKPTTTPEPKPTPDRTPKPKVSPGEVERPTAPDPAPSGDPQDKGD